MSAAPFIILQLRAKHFAGANYETGEGIVCNAIRDKFQYSHARIVETDTGANVEEYNYEYCDVYTEQMYKTDYKIAIENIFDNTPIRLLKLKLNNNVTV